ncbi:MAG: hypothetical protein IPL65_12650 [Lewinellaceae bacterium]|nr:hypothetical protein [Lewinellaceae bacterium]
MNIEPFEQPWQWVAADVNRSNTVSAYDIWLLRQLLLGEIAELREIGSYRFVDARYTFPFPFPLEDPLPETVEFYWDPSNPKPIAFQLAALKMGDVDGTSVHSFQSTLPAASLTLTAPVAFLAQGETTDLVLHVGETADYMGLQTAMRFNPAQLQVESVASGSLPNMSSDNFSTHRRGILTFSWFDVFPQTIHQEDALLVIRVKALQPMELSTALQFDEMVLPAEAYDASEHVLPLTLQFQEKSGKIAVISGEKSVFLNNDTDGDLFNTSRSPAEW